MIDSTLLEFYLRIKKCLPMGLMTLSDGAVFMWNVDFPAQEKTVSSPALLLGAGPGHTQAHGIIFPSLGQRGPCNRLLNSHCSSGAGIWHLASSFLLKLETMGRLSSTFRLVTTLTEIPLWRGVCPMYWLKCVQVLLILYFSPDWLNKWFLSTGPKKLGIHLLYLG